MPCHVGISYGDTGPHACIANHSTSSLLAVEEAMEALHTGDGDRAVVIGQDAPAEPVLLLYYHRWRTHLSLEMYGLNSRSVQLPAHGKVVEFLEVGGLHHHYEQLAA